MHELLSRMDGGEIIGLCAVAGGLLVAVISVIAVNWRIARVAEIEASLKRDLLTQGHSPEAVARVVSATAQAAEGGKKGC
jgi:hypothetical protein